jgi:hypothetical protein
MVFKMRENNFFLINAEFPSLTFVLVDAQLLFLSDNPIHYQLLTI